MYAFSYPMRFFFLLFCCLALFACATAPYTGRSQFITMSKETEFWLGFEATKEILSSEPVEKGTARATRVEQVGARIARAADRPDFQWAFYTINKPELNAFCLPGGRVFVYTRLLEFTEGNDAELAAVIGHEVAHVIARHGAERMSQAQAASLGGALLELGVSFATGSSAAGQTVQSGYSALAQLGLLLPFSRSQETEADYIGIILAAKAGYDPRAAITFWEKMIKESEGGKRPLAFLSTHPLSETRLADLRRMMPEALKYYDPSALPGCAISSVPYAAPFFYSEHGGANDLYSNFSSYRQAQWDRYNYERAILLGRERLAVQSERLRLERARLAWERQELQRLYREQELRSQWERDKARYDQQRREQQQREQQHLQQERRGPQREQQQRDQQRREQQQRDQQRVEQERREQQQREQQRQEQQQREQQRVEQERREQQQREQQRQEQQRREQQQREQQHLQQERREPQREQQQRAQQRREQQQRDQQRVEQERRGR